MRDFKDIENPFINDHDLGDMLSTIFDIPRDEVIDQLKDDNADSVEDWASDNHLTMGVMYDLIEQDLNKPVKYTMHLNIVDEDIEYIVDITLDGDVHLITNWYA